MLWWTGMGSHKAGGAATAARDMMARNAWEDAFYVINALLYDMISALSLLSVAESMIKRETQLGGSERPN